MAKARKPFVSRKKRKEIQASYERREEFMRAQNERMAAEDSDQSLDTEKKPITLPNTATVGEFAELLGLSVVKVISQLMKNGIMAAVTARIDFDTMSIVADELGFIPELGDGTQEVTQVEEVTPVKTEGGITRPPIVTVMGHVDHGKTSLLDKIRQTKVAQGEHGGITQHIGAYQAEVEYEGENRLITFLDTPGHEAFTALRSHGAQVTDIVILVVAADDGIKPQTIEAINHAKSAHVPIIVAITKVDLPSANMERVKQQLTEYELIAEEWGGKTPMVGVSSVTGDGINQLLEVVILTADLKEYTANPKAEPQGVVIESHQEVGLGPVATLLVQNGTVRTGDVLVMGQTFGKIRSMTDYRGKRISEALPSTPVMVSGIQDIPEFGDTFAGVKNEKAAREFIAKDATPAVRMGVSDISRAIAEGRVDTLKLIVKADAQGSLEAITTSIAKLSQPGVKPLVIHGAIGDITLTDVQLASASQAVVVGFNVNYPAPIKKSAHNLGVTVSTFTIIYDLLDQIESILKGLVKVEKIKVERGRFKVKKIFRSTKESHIIGGEITQGVALGKAFAVIMRDGEQVGEGRVTSLQKGPEAVNELEAVQECGMSVETNTKIAEGDVLIVSVEEEVVARDEA